MDAVDAQIEVQAAREELCALYSSRALNLPRTGPDSPGVSASRAEHEANKKSLKR